MSEGNDTDAQMTVKAAEAFAAYVGMGPNRTLRNLAHWMVEQDCYRTTTTALKVLAGWSKRYSWQSRIAEAATARSEEALAKAAEFDAQSFLRTSELIAGRLALTDAAQIDAVIKMRETVRRPTPKQGLDVSVKHSGRIDHVVRRPNLSALSDEELERLTEMAERVAVGEGVG